MHLAMADIDCGDMGRAAFEQHLREAPRRGAYVECFRAGRIEPETIEPGNQLQGRPGNIVARRIVHDQIDPGRHVLTRFRHHRSVDRDGAALDRIAGARAAGEQAARDEEVVEPLALTGWLVGTHLPSLAKATHEGKSGVTEVLPRKARL